MAEKEFYIDDRCIISEEVKRMSKQERQEAIERLEEEARKEKARLTAK